MPYCCNHWLVLHDHTLCCQLIFICSGTNMSKTEGWASWLGNHPELLAIIVLIAGWALAVMLRQALASAMLWINKKSSRLGSNAGPLISPGLGKAIQLLTFWGILATAVVVALQLLSGGDFSQWLAALLQLATLLSVALGILLAGHMLGRLARGLLQRVSGLPNKGSLPQLAYVAIMLLAVFTALEHLGLNISFATQLVLVVIAVVLAGLALAFAGGAKTLVANLVAQGDMQHYKPGDRLVVDGIEGTVLEIRRTGMVLSTDRGLATVPAAKFAESTVLEIHSGEPTDG
jgi:hypothetical protein